MKIDFNASYKDVAKLVSVPNSARSAGTEPIQGFKKLLGSIAPKIAQLAENTKKIDGPLKPEIPAPQLERGPMARMSFPEPELRNPILEPRVTPDPTIEPVNEPAEGVNTQAPVAPALLDARRIPIEQNFTEMKKQERMTFVKRELSELAPLEGVDPALGMSVISAESSFNTNAVSRDGHQSKGLFQLLDTTGRSYLKKMELGEAYDPFNPKQNMRIGMNYLRYLHDVFSKGTALTGKLHTVPAANSSSLEKLAVAAFNAGEGRVASAQQRAERAGLDPSEYLDVEAYLPETTQTYVTKVVESKGEFEGDF